MASKKRSAPPWQVILEEIRSQNGATIEAVDGTRVALEQKLDVLDAEVRARFALVESSVRSLGHETRERDSVLGAAIARFDQEGRTRDTSLEAALRDLNVSVQENSVDIRDLAE